MSELRTHLDFETRSLVDLPKLGEHAYARHWSTAPLMLTYGTAPKGVRPTFELIDFFEVPGYAEGIYPAISDPSWSILRVPCPTPILDAIARGDTFVAHNARFEQAIYYHICHRKWGWPMPVRWSCTAARSRYFGIRASLAGSASDLEVVHQKDERGKQFIDDFCKPRKYKGPKANGIVQLLWFEPSENTEGWRIGKEYCVKDGEAEADVDAILPDLPPFEQAVWDWDFAINTRGVPIDTRSVERAILFSDHYTTASFKRFEEITALRPTQRDRVLEYLQQREEIADLGDLRSKTLNRLTLSEFPTDLQDVIQIRLDCSLASVKKLATMARCTDDDGRARGIHLYGGASTMRWSAKRIQTQNMKRGKAKEQAFMFDFLTNGVWEAGNNAPADMTPMWIDDANLLFPRPLRTLSLSMRGFVAAPKGKIFRTSDFAQIEARVLAWLARCMWLLDAFKVKQDPYCRFAGGFMYNRGYDEYFDPATGKPWKDKEPYVRERQMAKSAVLGAGFGLGKKKFVEYCDNVGLIITQEEADRTIGAYRDAHPEIVSLWARVEQAAILATANPGQVYQLGGTGVKFYTWHIDEERYWLKIELPSGRCIHYYRPKVEYKIKWGKVKETLTFRAEWNAKSYREDTYGGKIVENIVQAIARDILCCGGLNAERAGYEVVMLVHDETVALTDVNFGSHEELSRLLCQLPDWITDLPVEAEGASMVRYGK